MNEGFVHHQPNNNVEKKNPNEIVLKEGYRGILGEKLAEYVKRMENGEVTNSTYYKRYFLEVLLADSKVSKEEAKKILSTQPMFGLEFSEKAFEVSWQVIYKYAETGVLTLDKDFQEKKAA